MVTIIAKNSLYLLNDLWCGDWPVVICRFLAENMSNNVANIPEVLAHAIGAQMNSICQKEIW